MYDYTPEILEILASSVVCLICMRGWLYVVNKSNTEIDKFNMLGIKLNFFEKYNCIL